MKKTRRGFFFLIDVIFAVLILGIGFFLIVHKEPQKTEIPLLQNSENAIEFLSTIKGNEICNNCECNLLLSKYCSNMNHTIIQIAGYLYSNSKKTEAGELIKNITYYLIPKDMFSYEFIMNGETLVFQGEDNAKELISSKRVVFGYYENPENGEVLFFGPYLAELRMWR